MDSPTAAKILNFSDLFISVLNIEFVRRKAPDLPMELRFAMATFIGILILFILNIGFTMVFVTFIRGTHYETSELSEAVERVSVYLITMFRGYTLLVKREKINRLLIKLENLFPVTKEQQIKFRLHYYADLIVFRNKTLKTLISISTIEFIFFPLLKSMFCYFVLGSPFIYRVPSFSWYPFNAQKLQWYVCVYIYQIIASVFTFLFYANEDFIFSSSVTQICMHYQYLSTLVSELDARNEVESTSGLRNFVHYQHDVESLLSDINDTFSMSTFIGFTIVKVTMCAYFFSILYGTGVLENVPFILCIATLIVSIYQRCSIGERILEASSSILTAIYNHNWYQGSPRYRKIVVIMMIRANRPVFLEASTIRKLSMEYFKEIAMETY